MAKKLTNIIGSDTILYTMGYKIETLTYYVPTITKKDDVGVPETKNYKLLRPIPIEQCAHAGAALRVIADYEGVNGSYIGSAVALLRAGAIHSRRRQIPGEKDSPAEKYDNEFTRVKPADLGPEDYWTALTFFNNLGLDSTGVDRQPEVIRECFAAQIQRAGQIKGKRRIIPAIGHVIHEVLTDNRILGVKHPPEGTTSRFPPKNQEVSPPPVPIIKELQEQADEPEQRISQQHISTGVKAAVAGAATASAVTIGLVPADAKYIGTASIIGAFIMGYKFMEKQYERLYGNFGKFRGRGSLQKATGLMASSEAVSGAVDVFGGDSKALALSLGLVGAGAAGSASKDIARKVHLGMVRSKFRRREHREAKRAQRTQVVYHEPDLRTSDMAVSTIPAKHTRRNRKPIR